MLRPTVVLALFIIVALFGLALAANQGHAPAPANQPQAVPANQTPAGASPAEGYNVHVLAPHLVDGKEMGPYHHYCKVYAPDPQIVCLIYESTDPNAMLAQIEWIYAKKLTRKQVPLKTWNKNWHDHAVEIAGGRVKVLDLPDDKAKEVADLVATTDGMIYHFYFNSALPNGKMSIAQAVGHKPLTAEQFKNYQMKAIPAAAPR
ncbi:MAG TPA: DUF1264 domain-containing protein [Terriglobales bacterium]|nr:DUF1264 domain-containing protein [Terriglobales bacterium]